MPTYIKRSIDSDFPLGHGYPFTALALRPERYRRSLCRALMGLTRFQNTTPVRHPGLSLFTPRWLTRGTEPGELLSRDDGVLPLVTSMDNALVGRDCLIADSRTSGAYPFARVADDIAAAFCWQYDRLRYIPGWCRPDGTPVDYRPAEKGWMRFTYYDLHVIKFLHLHALVRSNAESASVAAAMWDDLEPFITRQSVGGRERDCLPMYVTVGSQPRPQFVGTDYTTYKDPVPAPAGRNTWTPLDPNPRTPVKDESVRDYSFDGPRPELPIDGSFGLRVVTLRLYNHARTLHITTHPTARAAIIFDAHQTLDFLVQHLPALPGSITADGTRYGRSRDVIGPRDVYVQGWGCAVADALGMLVEQGDRSLALRNTDAWPVCDRADAALETILDTLAAAQLPDGLWGQTATLKETP